MLFLAGSSGSGSFCGLLDSQGLIEYDPGLEGAHE